jgi:hypothetical protein
LDDVPATEVALDDAPAAEAAPDEIGETVDSQATETIDEEK